jgi:cell division septation protein DedD
VNRIVLIALLILSLGVSSGCSRRQQEWEAARSTDTVESYQQFLKSFPDGEFASQAQARVRELEEAADWQNATRADTAEAYQEFLNRWPQGRMADEARIRIGNFALAQTPSSSPAESPAAIMPPQGDGGATAPTAAAAAVGGGYRVQLGAFSGGDKQAMGEWRRLLGQYPELLGGLTPSVKLATTTTGHVYRLQAGLMTEARARETCAQLKSRGQTCVVVLP